MYSSPDELERRVVGLVGGEGYASFPRVCRGGKGSDGDSETEQRVLPTRDVEFDNEMADCVEWKDSADELA